MSLVLVQKIENFEEQSVSSFKFLRFCFAVESTIIICFCKTCNSFRNTLAKAIDQSAMTSQKVKCQFSKFMLNVSRYQDASHFLGNLPYHGT